MTFLAVEKTFPAFNRFLIAVAIAAMAPHALAGAEEDYKAGLEAYRVNDVVGAMDPLKRAADAGHAGAQALYGSILDSAELDAEAADYLRKSAAQNNPEGMFGLARMYLTGDATADDPTAAGRLMRASAAAGNRLAIAAMASAFIRADKQLDATEQSSIEATQFIQKAADQGELVAIGAIAEGYRLGKYGLPVDAEKAKEWELKHAQAISGASQGARK